MLERGKIGPVVVVLSGLLLAGCGGSETPAVDAGGVRADAGVMDAASRADAGTSLDAATAPDAVAPDAGEPEPPPPVFPDVIDHLSFAVLTGSGVNDGTDANSLSLCLDATHCFAMNIVDVNDFRRGELDVYHFDAVGLPRSAVDRVEIRSSGGTDAWRPTCVEVRFDGEPVYCQDGLTTFFGNGAATEVASWRDPAGIHEACQTCYPSSLTHGPMIGDTTGSSARVLVRTDATRRTRVRLVSEASPADTHARVLYPSPHDDYTAVFDVDGLTPETRYAVEVEVEGAVVGTASVTTAPATGAPGAFLFAFGSCSRDRAQPIFATIQALSPDAFLFVGDNHYGNTPDLQSLWWNYRYSLEVPERARLLSATPTLAIWDDHDYVGNNTDGSAAGKESALRAFGDYWANPSAGLPAEPGVYFHASWGDVDFFMLDDRYERSAPGSAGGTIIGPEQAAWLERELEASTATFRVIASGTIFSPTGDETWLDYPTSRTRLFDFIRDRPIPGVVLISGDVHRSQLRKIHRSGAYDLPEVVSSPLANVNSGCPASVEPDAAQLACVASGHYFATLEVDTTRADPRLVARLIDEAGTIVGSMTVLRSELE